MLPRLPKHRTFYPPTGISEGDFFPYGESPGVHGTRIWDRSEIRPFSPVYTRIRPVRGSQIRPVPWFSCVYGRILVRFQIRPVPCINKRGPSFSEN